jgi:hypothetical protein
MTILTTLTQDPNQANPIILPDGSKAVWTLYYRPQQKGWTYDLSWSNPLNPALAFSLRGQRLVAGPNIIRQFRNQLPFGLMVQTAGQVEPIAQTTFTDGTTTVYVLDPQDVTSIETQIFAGN